MILTGRVESGSDFLGYANDPRINTQIDVRVNDVTGKVSIKVAPTEMMWLLHSPGKVFSCDLTEQ